MEDSPYVGDIGLKLVVTIINASTNAPRDISQATVKQLFVKRPGNTSFTKDMNFVSNGIDGQLQYVSATGDLSKIGTYMCQVKLTLPDWSGSTSIFSFNVKSTL